MSHSSYEMKLPRHAASLGRALHGCVYKQTGTMEDRKDKRKWTGSGAEMEKHPETSGAGSTHRSGGRVARGQGGIHVGKNSHGS